MGTCRLVWQTAYAPHVPGQGSRHLLLRQARSDGHSESLRHSGRQLGGSSNIGGRQEQCATVPSARQILLGPQGFGVHGSDTAGAIKLNYDNIYVTT